MILVYGLFRKTGNKTVTGEDESQMMFVGSWQDCAAFASKSGIIGWMGALNHPYFIAKIEDGK